VGCLLSRIKDRAFEGCFSLGSIRVPATVRVLGRYSFSQCHNLASVTFESGSKLSKIKDFAFYKTHHCNQFVFRHPADMGTRSLLMDVLVTRIPFYLPFSGDFALTSSLYHEERLLLCVFGTLERL
jgi:hypothetical protein